MKIYDYIDCSDGSKIKCLTYRSDGYYKWFPILPVKLDSGKYAWLKLILRTEVGTWSPGHSSHEPDGYIAKYKEIK